MTITPITRMARDMRGRFNGVRQTSGHRQQVDLPPSGHHGVLEISHEPPYGIHPAGSRPWLASVASAKDIEEHNILLRWFRSTFSRRTSIVGVQVPNQLGVFFHDDPRDEVGGWDHAALFEFPPAARQWAG